ncbi:MAG: molecular chaperone [Oleiphilus sp.]
MISGFDYGTSNCAVGVSNDNSDNVKLLGLENDQAFMPSLLYALNRELICEKVGQSISSDSIRQDFINVRAEQLARAQQVHLEEGFARDEQTVFVGQSAFDEYIQWPGEGYFVKSPKSFLGASGLRPEAIYLFEDIVTAMMQAIKQRAELSLGETLTHTVIGRPVNFQGLQAEQSNQQALDILTVSAKRAGFKEVEFLFEPIAAGLNFEQSLTEDKRVLVVDIGGGTTDCAMVRMGPSFKASNDRSADFLGHSGERVGGNDLDILLAGKHLMPLFGMRSMLKNGLPVPTQSFWDAISTNDVSAQASFNHLDTTLHLEQLARDCREPDLIKRFIRMRAAQQQHQVVRSAETTKISLSSQSQVAVDFSYIEAGLQHQVKESDFAAAIQRPLEKMLHLMQDAITQAGVDPQLIFITGGSGQSPVVRSAIKAKFGNIQVLDGDHFGSVAAGLTVWANQIYK